MVVAILNTLGQAGAGLADGDASGAIDGDDYDVWKMHFGETAGSGAGAGAGYGTRSVPTTFVPEPASAMLLVLAAMGLVTVRRGRSKVAGTFRVL